MCLRERTKLAALHICKQLGNSSEMRNTEKFVIQIRKRCQKQGAIEFINSYQKTSCKSYINAYKGILLTITRATNSVLVANGHSNSSQSVWFWIV